MTIKIKRWAAVFMLLSLFLPLAQLKQCTTFRLPDGTSVTGEHIVDIYAYNQAWTEKEYTETPLFLLAVYVAFLWPLILSITSLIWPGLNQKWYINVLELLLCVGSVYMLGGITFFQNLRYGFYVAGGSIVLYFVTTLAELVARVRKKWVNKHNHMFQQTHAYGTRR